jgi:hypothetical protein
VAARLGSIEDASGKPLKMPHDEGVWALDDDDFLLYSLVTDPVYCAELLGEDPSNQEWGGMFIVMDYQYPLFRMGDEGAYVGAACARSVGKTESVKWRSVAHCFKRIKENLLLTAPELIHLLPLTDAIEGLIRSIRLLREFLDVSGGKTGFTHRPFGVLLQDGTQIVGRIPRLTGTGVKGQHQRDLMVDEAQDYPEAGWTEVHETVMKDRVDEEGNPDFNYHFYGVHTGARDSGFHARIAGGAFKVLQVTALQRPRWNKAEKDAAKAAYGGTASPDYRRNILGEAGAAASPFFVTARLVACMDQDRESAYNTVEYRHQLIRVEEFDEMMLPIRDVLDLPSGPKNVWGGMDIGLTNSPTVITLWSEERVGKRTRLKLFRRIHLERMRTRTIREALYAIGLHYGTSLKGFGSDITGLGFPIFQEMEDDEACPAHLKKVHRGYFFNVKIDVGVDKEHVTTDEQGRMRDALGAQVREEVDPLTNEKRYISEMPFIEASTRYLREFVDTGLMLLPFDPEIIGDFQGETQQRVKRISGLKQKPNAFHILDSSRAMAARRMDEQLAPQFATTGQVPVLEVAF